MAVDELEIRVGQLWRRRRDGRPFIPARKVTDGWLDRLGRKRTPVVLRTQYLLVETPDWPSVGEQSAIRPPSTTQPGRHRSGRVAPSPELAD
jgi:hypothetical protein